MAVIDFRHRPNARGFVEILSADTPKQVAQKQNTKPEAGRIRSTLRKITHVALLGIVVAGSYHAYSLAQQAQFNLMVLLP